MANGEAAGVWVPMTKKSVNHAYAARPQKENARNSYTDKTDCTT